MGTLPEGAMERGGLFLSILATSPIGCRVGYVTSVALIACLSCVHGGIVSITRIRIPLTLHGLAWWSEPIDMLWQPGFWFVFYSAANFF